MKEIKKLVKFTALGLYREIRKYVKLLSPEECNEYTYQERMYIDCIRESYFRGNWEERMEAFGICKYAGEEIVGEVYCGSAEEYYSREEALELLVQFIGEGETPISQAALSRMKEICNEIQMLLTNQQIVDLGKDMEAGTEVFMDIQDERRLYG